MPIRTLGKAMFPRQQAWQRERRVKTILIVIGVSLVFAAVVCVVMFTSNSRTH